MRCSKEEIEIRINKDMYGCKKGVGTSPGSAYPNHAAIHLVLGVSNAKKSTS